MEDDVGDMVSVTSLPIDPAFGRVNVFSSCLVSDGVVALGLRYGEVVLYDLRTGTARLLEGFSRVVRSMCMASKSILASASDDGLIRMWDVNSGECKHVLHLQSGWSSSICMATRTILACGVTDCSVMLFNVQTGECIGRLQGYSGWVLSVCSIDQETGVFAGGDYKGNIRIWNAHTGACLASFRGHDNKGSVLSQCDHRISSLCMVSPTILASSAYDGSVKLWNVENVASIRCLGQWVSRYCIDHTFMATSDVMACVYSRSVWDGGAHWGLLLRHVYTGDLVHSLPSQCDSAAFRTTCMVSADTLLSDSNITQTPTLHLCRINYRVPLRRIGEDTNNPGSAFTSAVILPGQKRTTYSQSAFAVVREGIARSVKASKKYTSCGSLGLPDHLLRMISELI